MAQAILKKEGLLWLSFFLLLPLPVFSSQDLVLKNQEAWEKLLYFKSLKKSEIDSPAFFLAGGSSYKKEWQAHVEAFQKNLDQIDDLHPVCRFPARYIFFNRETGLGDVAYLQKCSKLNAFLKRVGWARVSLVFSSYYMGNPSSTFGHTLLKISKKKFVENQEEDPLLSYGLNYAANTDTASGFLYALKGLFGFFKGTFTLLPFYYKVREYNDYESRDLWVYDINFTEEEKKFLVHHIWELGDSFAYYYFTSKNCSYLILKSLEAVRPGLNMTENLPFYVIPSETVKEVVKEKGLVKKIHYRPSVKSRLEARLNNLNNKEKKRVYKNVRSLEKGAGLVGKMEKVSEADAAIELYDFLNAKNLVAEEKLYMSKKHPLLVARSQMEGEEEKLRYDLKPPDQMHPMSYWSLGYSQREGGQKKRYHLSTRLAFHSLLENTDGAMEAGEIVLGRLDFSYNKDEKLKFYGADWVKVSNLDSMTAYKVPLAWNMNLKSFRNLKNEKLEHSFSIGGGYSLGLSPWTKFYFLTYSRILYWDTFFEPGLYYDLGANLGARVKWTENFFSTISLEAYIRNNLRHSFNWNENYLGNFTSQYNMESIALRAGLQFDKEELRGAISFLYYY